MPGQSTKVQELVQDLNLVFRLEYGMHLLRKDPPSHVRIAAVDLLNRGISHADHVEIDIAPVLPHVRRATPPLFFPNKINKTAPEASTSSGFPVRFVLSVEFFTVSRENVVPL